MRTREAYATGAWCRGPAHDKPQVILEKAPKDSYAFIGEKDIISASLLLCLERKPSHYSPVSTALTTTWEERDGVEAAMSKCLELGVLPRLAARRGRPWRRGSGGGSEARPR